MNIIVQKTINALPKIYTEHHAIRLLTECGPTEYG